MSSSAISIHVVGEANASLLDHVDDDVFDHEVQPKSAACLRPHPGEALPIGTETDSVELGASEEIITLGEFAYSTNRWAF